MRQTPMLLSFALVFCSGCNRSAETPQAAYEQMVRAVQKDDLKDAFALLSTRTRTELQAQANALHLASGGTIAASPEKLIFFATRAPPTEVKVLTLSGDRATLQVVAPESTAEVQVVKEAGGWRVDLPTSEKPPR